MAFRYSKLTPEQRDAELNLLWEEYRRFQSMNLSLDMSRGKPCAPQLELSNELFQGVSEGFKTEAGVDSRNYGELTGIAEMKRVFAQVLHVNPENTVIGGNSSLNLMFDTISRAMTHGVAHSERPWCQEGTIKFLCPVPGYDRHFALTAYFGIEMVNIPMTDEGPDMDLVEQLVREDASIKGIWCVPVYSNPTGAIYSDEVIVRLAKMPCAAPDFTIMWDNAYAVHHLYGQAPEQMSILDACTRAGHAERAIQFASTSKITFSGAGVACVAGSAETLKCYQKTLFVQTIGFNKINQLLHARFLKDMDGVTTHMAKHAVILRPKFKIVDEVLTEHLSGLEIATWSKPLGGYFINFVTPKNTASRIVQLCGEANVKLTPAGAAFPYGKDPDDNNIRIAPTFPAEDELRIATHLLTVCTRIAALEKDLQQ